MKYTALTIGPIQKTLQSVKSTKALWAASYLFSYLMKEIIKKAQLNSAHVILPYHEKSDLDIINGVGLFPDRLIVKDTIPKLQNIVDEVIKEFAEKVSTDIKENAEEVQAYLNEYLSIHIIEVDLKATANVIDYVNKLLNTAELKQPLLHLANKDHLNRFLEEKFYNFLVTTEFDKKEKRFPSTIEIANSELKDVNLNKFNDYVNVLFKGKKDEDKTDNQQKFIEKIKTDPKFKETYRNYQKYIAVVQADGDNTGAFIEQLYKMPKSTDLIRRFSKNLMQFSKEAIALINKYKGTPIYAGGDDLLFIAPVAHTAMGSNGKVYVEKSILTLIDEIDTVFYNLFTNYNEDGFDFKNIIEKLNKKPSMSYGISISYYKFPLNEALTEGVNQLFHIAKQTCHKNAVSFAVRKHSGQYFGTTFHKYEQSYDSYKDLINQQVKDADYIHGVAYKLEPQKAVFYGIGLEVDDKKRNIKFDNFFSNNFNESIHIHINHLTGEKELIPFLKSLKQLFKDVYTEHKVVSAGTTNDEKTAINTHNLNKIYAALRFIGFLNDKEER